MKRFLCALLAGNEPRGLGLPGMAGRGSEPCDVLPVLPGGRHTVHARYARI